MKNILVFLTAATILLSGRTAYSEQVEFSCEYNYEEITGVKDDFSPIKEQKVVNFKYNILYDMDTNVALFESIVMDVAIGKGGIVLMGSKPDVVNGTDTFAMNFAMAPIGGNKFKSYRTVIASSGGGIVNSVARGICAAKVLK